MKGADRYADLIPTGQYGRLYCVSGVHARGSTFNVYVLPADEDAIPNGKCNPPLNVNTVEVFGVVNGLPGWTEEYGWLHNGPWQDDLEKLRRSFELQREREREKRERMDTTEELARKEHERVKTLLATYPGNDVTMDCERR